MSDPTPAIKKRSEAWLTAVDHVETYLQAAAQRYDGISAATNKLSVEMPQFEDLGNQFAPVGKGGIQDLFAKLWWDLNLPDGKAAETASGAIKKELLPELTKLREYLTNSISSFSGSGLPAEPATTTNSTQPESSISPAKSSINDPSFKKRLDEYAEAIATAESGKQPTVDPYLLKLQIDRKFETSIAPKKSTRERQTKGSNLQETAKKLDGEVSERLQKILRDYTNIVERNAHIIADGAKSVRSVFVDQPKLFEYKYWLASSSGASAAPASANTTEPQQTESPVLNYPKEDSPYGQPVRRGTLERRNKFIHTYSAGEYVLTPLSLIEIRQNSPAWAIDLIGATLRTDHKAAQDPNQFVIKARQHGSSSGKFHTFVFRAQVTDNWKRDLETITSGEIPSSATDAASAVSGTPYGSRSHSTVVSPTQSKAVEAHSSRALREASPAPAYEAVDSSSHSEAVAAAPITHEPRSEATQTLAAAPLTAVSAPPAERALDHTAVGEQHIAAAPIAGAAAVAAAAAGTGHLTSDVTPTAVPIAMTSTNANHTGPTATVNNTETGTSAEALSKKHIAKVPVHEHVSAAPITHSADGSAAEAAAASTLAAAPIAAAETMNGKVQGQIHAAEASIPAVPLAAAGLHDVPAQSVNAATVSNTSTSTSADRLDISAAAKSSEHTGTSSSGPVLGVPLSHKQAQSAGDAPLTAAPVHHLGEEAAAEVPQQFVAGEQHIAAAPIAAAAVGGTETETEAKKVTPSVVPLAAVAGDDVHAPSVGAATSANTDYSTSADRLNTSKVQKTGEHPAVWHSETVAAVPVGLAQAPTAGHAPLAAAPISAESRPAIPRQTSAAQETSIMAAPVALAAGNGAAEESKVTPSVVPIQVAASSDTAAQNIRSATVANTDISTSASQLKGALPTKSDEHHGISKSEWEGEHVAAVPITHEPVQTAPTPLTSAPLTQASVPVAKQTKAAETHIAAAPLAVDSAAVNSKVTPTAVPIATTADADDSDGEVSDVEPYNDEGTLAWKAKKDMAVFGKK